MKHWGYQVVTVATAALFMGLSACAKLNYDSISDSKSKAPSYSEANGKIVLSSICAEHEAGSKSYNQCATQADNWLDDQCDDYRRLFTSSDGNTAQRYRHEYYKFCDAAEAWQAPAPSQ